jgi:predicted phosphodiesterase
VDGIVVPLAGDILTGDIHPELLRTNEAPVQASVVHWVPILASALRRLADEFGHVFVPTCDGNHDRDAVNHRTPTKKRTESSYAWIIYNWLADTLRDDPRVEFSISVSPEQRFDVYDTRFLLTHGDAFRSQGGVGGLYPALLKYLLRKHQAYSALRNDFDYALMGHWHQLLWGQDFVVNGSLKGWDEYARHLGFAPEPARQALFIVTPERGITHQLPVYAE